MFQGLGNGWARHRNLQSRDCAMASDLVRPHDYLLALCAFGGGEKSKYDLKIG